jgi:hypothetical protein
MGKVLMKKTVFDNRSGYHRAGEFVTVSADVERHYLLHGYATLPVEELPAVIEAKPEAIEAETKEQKIVYKTKGNKAKKDEADQD